jgi:beta-lactam-binding protein with PASTA domain
MVRVPNIAGLSADTAKQRLTGLGFKVVDMTAAPYLPDKDKQNKVVYQSPDPGTELHYGQVVTIYVNRP